MAHNLWEIVKVHAFCIFSRLDASVPGGGEPAADDDPVAPGQGGGRQRENDQRFYCRAFISHIKAAGNITKKYLDLSPGWTCYHHCCKRSDSETVRLIQRWGAYFLPYIPYIPSSYSRLCTKFPHKRDLCIVQQQRRRQRRGGLQPLLRQQGDPSAGHGVRIPEGCA